MKKITNNLVIISNVVLSILFIIPAFKLNLFDENYSTLSLTTRGYLFNLVLGILIGILLGYETYYISSKKNSLIIFMSLLIGTIIPHHVPYNFQGNLHLIFAYIGFFGLVSISLFNCKLSKVRNMYLMLLSVAIFIYLRCGMVNTLSEVIVMISTLFVNMYNYFRTNK